MELDGIWIKQIFLQYNDLFVIKKDIWTKIKKLRTYKDGIDIKHLLIM
jgi:biotin operon repressor